MDKQSTEFKSLIYDLMNGSLDLEHFPVEESKYVENEYEEENQVSKTTVYFIFHVDSPMQCFFLQTSARCCFR